MVVIFTISPMNADSLRQLLEKLRRGDIGVDGAVDALAHLPYEDLGDVRIDHHRRLRRGVPEIIFGQGKTPEQILRIAKHMAEAGGPVLATRLSPAALHEIEKHLPDATLHPSARMAVMGSQPRQRQSGIVVCCAGTTDLPVADEAAITLQALGHQVTRITDVGVAGLHRLLGSRAELTRASVVIAVAGMEGALPSVVAGLVPCPVIGVPTSVGYGVAFGGVTALMSMLTSCAGGLVVVNIDNGLGAALAADLMVRQKAPESGKPES
jgi:NCAIR mutase (PurE)-related protein